jgi:hypothetical protein
MTFLLSGSRSRLVAFVHWGRLESIVAIGSGRGKNHCILYHSDAAGDVASMKSIDIVQQHYIPTAMVGGGTGRLLVLVRPEEDKAQSEGKIKKD